MTRNRTNGRTGSRWGRATLVACVALLAPAARGEDRAADGYDAVRHVLRRKHQDDQRTQRDLVLELAELGPERIPVLYDLVVGRGLDRLLGAGGDWAPAAWVCEPDEIGAVSQQALERLPARHVVAHLEKELGGADLSQKLLALRILGGLGSQEGLELAWRTAASCGDRGLAHANVRRSVIAALGAILRDNPRAFEWVEERASEASPLLCLALVDSVVAAEDPRGMACLQALLREFPEQQAAVLEGMAELERLFPWRLAGGLTSHLTRLARSPDWEERRLFAALEARVHDVDLVPGLIDLLDDGDGRVQRAAVLAIEEVGRLPLGRDAAAWEAWYEREHAWWEQEGGALAETLLHTANGRATEALRELSQHPLYRHEAARTIGETLLRQPTPSCIQACNALITLGSRAAIPGLLAAIERGHAQLRNSAWRALRDLTTANLPLSADVWREYLAE